MNLVDRVHRTRTVRPPRDRWTAAAAGAAYVGIGVLHRHRPRAVEGRIFAAVNHRTPSRPILVVPQQLGTPWILPGIAVVAFVRGHPHLAGAAALALPVEKALEVGVKKVVQRPRPAAVDPQVRLHDDAPTEGPSYPSGHTAIAFTGLLLLVPAASPRLRVAGAVGAVLATWVRVRQGAHFPMDAVGGAVLGLTVVSTVRALAGRPTDPGQL